MTLKIKALIKLLAVVALIATTAGCAIFQGSDEFVVNDSQLNWMIVKYRPADKARKPCYLNIIGVGSVEFKQGNSPLVFNSFSQEVDHPQWGDIDEEKLGVSPDDARWMMQLFVDAGLMKERKRLRKLSKEEKNDMGKGIAVFTSKINNEPYQVATSNPEIIETLEKVINSITSTRGFH